MSVVVEDEPVRMEKMTYEEIVKAIIVDETQYLRDLNMIIRVFRAPFVELFPRSKVSKTEVTNFHYFHVLFHLFD